ncbi:MAG: ATP-binding cassette domain-containing protein [Opitutales bacterium]|nr:ATP-binding cassette domain-containing protein [Opitutales bacterium]
MLLQLSGINLKRGIHILRNIHWSMTPDQNWVILGSNGSGKTSILNVIMGYEPPSSGQFMVFGNPFGTIPWEETRKKIGIVSQSIGQRIEPDQLAQNIVISGKSAHINQWRYITEKEKEEAKRWLYLVGIEHLAERKWGVLSQGERQRTLIARALILRPKILILDEPCAGLDPVARESFLEFLQYTLTEEFHIPTVMITHHIEEILPMFTDVMLMKKGEIIDLGSKEEMLNSEKLSTVFNTEIVVQPVANRYYLHMVKA